MIQLLFVNAADPFRDGFAYIKEIFSTSFGIKEVIDILALSAIVFLLWFFFRKSKIAHYVAGIFGVLIVLTGISIALQLNAVSYFLKVLLLVALLGGMIVFEMRLIDQLSKGGNFSLSEWLRSVFHNKKGKNEGEEPIDAICQAAVDLSRTKTGGLIVIERKNKLDDLIHTGVDIDALVSPYLIRNIFYEGAPLHDGPLIIRHGRIFSAGCILPITHRLDVNTDLGTRHRAAIGMSENSDAVIIVISEESSIISVACNAEFTREYNYRTLKNELIRLLSQFSGEDDDNE